MKNRFLMGAMLLGALAPAAPAAWASSHREAPAIAGMPRVDATDFYMFRSYEPGREQFVTLIANYLPLQAPYGGPNYFTLDNSAVYEIHIDNTGDANEDLTFQFNFSSNLINDGKGQTYGVGGVRVATPLRQLGEIDTVRDPNINERESYTLKLITGNRRTGVSRDVVLAGSGGQVRFAKPIDNIGEKTLPDYAGYANSHIFNINIPGCRTNGKVFVGQRAEAFAVNLGEIFDLVNLVPIQGAPSVTYPQYDSDMAFTGGIMQDRANDDLIGHSNVTSLALELPISCLKRNGNGVIGAWTTASLRQTQVRDASPTYNGTVQNSGDLVQVSRLSAPLVNEIVIGLKDKDLFNAARPRQDGALATYVTNPVFPTLLDALFRDAVGASSNIAPSNYPRNDLVAAFLTGFPGLNQLATVRGSEMMRLNTGVPPTPRANQHTFGVVAEDLAGFPNGRRPGDDVVDIALRVAMGALCHDVPLGAELGVSGAVENTPSDNINLLLCGSTREQSIAAAPVGNQPFTDGAPLKATELQNVFPYLNTPIPGSPND